MKSIVNELKRLMLVKGFPTYLTNQWFEEMICSEELPQSERLLSFQAGCYLATNDEGWCSFPKQ